ncbi:hypothetical protein NSQ38_28095 [Paenibacillus sp. FSL R7-0313]|uniref:hypothetical protein n=1 Tax=Paenibacillus sp. FSL R7-0313 TaxID=2954532 RepID=UPI0030D86A81
MNFEETVSDFLLLKDGESASRPRGYYKDLIVFNAYLKSIDVTDNNITEFVKGINTDTIIKSIDFYIKQNNIKKMSTVQRYVSAVKEFLLYVVTTGYVSNTGFIQELGAPAYTEESFRNKVNLYIAECTLLDKSASYDPLTYHEVKDLIEECDLALDIPTTGIKRSKEMNMTTAALIIKLILLTGIPYREIIKIPQTSYNKSLGSFCANGMTIRLPEGLIKQFNSYIELRAKITHVKELFVTYDGQALSSNTAQVVYWLKRLSGRQDLTGIIKFAIIQMMKLDVNQVIIENFTKVGMKIIQSCKEQFLLEQALTIEVDLDSKLRRSKIFNIL